MIDRANRGNAKLPPDIGQVVLVLQGGGALGAYQIGVYQALHEAGIEPDWVIGTSIGAINASLIAGNSVADRLSRLKEFWARVQRRPFFQTMAALPFFGRLAANYLTVAGGIPGFFEPNPLAFFGPYASSSAGSAAFYSMEPLQQTLNELMDFARIDSRATRLTVGAANVRTGEMHYFDSHEIQLNAKHVMASGALPPAFPPVRIDGDLYWDGGILSNTPLEVVFDDHPRRNSLVFAVHLWNPQGSEPETIWQALNRQKDIQYASRAATHIVRQKQLHRLRHVISELANRMPEQLRQTPEIQALAEYGCLTRMHVVRLLAPTTNGEDLTKDIDFSPNAIQALSAAGYADASRLISMAPWEGDFDPLEGIILHEARNGSEATSRSGTALTDVGERPAIGSRGTARLLASGAARSTATSKKAPLKCRHRNQRYDRQRSDRRGIPERRLALAPPNRSARKHRFCPRFAAAR
jgi:NTE family protein